MSTTSGPGVEMLGKPVADAIEARLREAVPRYLETHKQVPTLAVVLVGDDQASRRYVGKKIEACARLGMLARTVAFPADISADGLANEVAQLSASPAHHGILVQLPLPAIEAHDAATTNKFDVFDAIAPEKDVDGVGRDAVAALYRAQQERIRLMPGTALAVRRMMAFYGVKTEGKLAVVEPAETTSRRSPSCTCWAAACATPRPSGATATWLPTIRLASSGRPTSWSPRSARARTGSRPTW